MRLPALLLVLLVAGCSAAPAVSAPPAVPTPSAQDPAAQGSVGQSPVGQSPVGQGPVTKSSSGHGPSGHPSGRPLTISGGGQFTASSMMAIVYDAKLVPAGAQASATVESAGGKTLSSLVVEGLLPSRTYGVHLHVNPCGGKPDDAGPHYQHSGPHADPGNEVWLDVATDETGEATASANHPWALAAGRLPRAVVIHAQPTKTAGTDAGTAGSRAACLTLTAQ